MPSSLLHCKVCPSHKDNSNFLILEIFIFLCVSKRLSKHSFQEKKSHLFWELSQKNPKNPQQNTHPQKTPHQTQKPTQQTIWHPYFHGYNLKKRLSPHIQHASTCYVMADVRIWMNRKKLVNETSICLVVDQAQKFILVLYSLEYATLQRAILDFHWGFILWTHCGH